jgi:pimeloyl-ACP methyl ester carboxylesterase
VLFIPGNAGSASQVRSLGAEAYRLVQHHHGGRQSKVVDLFAAHFDEELSAFDGGLIADQVEHVVHCIDAILQAYRGVSHSRSHARNLTLTLTHPNNAEGSLSGGTSSRPTSVILVGHSMGGFVARALFVHPAFRPTSVDTVITLNTPHR